MGKDQQIILDVFTKLEETFSGAKEFDEVLMDLELHTAKVRKDFPSLFQALQSKSAVVKPSRSLSDEELIELRKIARSKAIVQNNGAHSDPPQAAQEVTPLNNFVDDAPPAYKYDDWVTGQAKSSRIGEEWLLEWGKPIPMPDEGGPLTIPTEAGRIRFQVIMKDESTSRMRVRMIAVLPR